jgi:hypothetical protein
MTAAPPRAGVAAGLNPVPYVASVLTLYLDLNRTLGEIPPTGLLKRSTFARNVYVPMSRRKGYLGGLAAQSESPDLLQTLLNQLPAGSGDLSWSNVTNAAGGTGSRLISAGTRTPPALFGKSANTFQTALVVYHRQQAEEVSK